MQVKKRWGVVGLSLAASAFGALGVVGGCQSDSDDGGGTAGSGNASSGNPGSGGTGASGGSGSSTSNGGAGGSTSTGAQSGGAGGGPQTCNPAPEHTVKDLTDGTVGDQVNVTVTGVVAMSHKFLVSKSNASGSCLWGVFVSAPGLTTTEANSGILVISYGNEATTDDEGNTFCSKLGEEPTGGNIPDDTKPGDILDIPNGKTSHFLLSQCATEENGSTVKAIQLATHFTGCPIEKTGTAAVPAPAVLTTAQIAQLGSPSDKAFHDAWGGVFVRVEDVTPIPYPAADCEMDATTPCIVGPFGQINIEEGTRVGDKLYYRGYDDNICHKAPEFADDLPAFDFVQGFSILDFCSWNLFPQDKCADFGPQSGDCTGATCPYTGD
jgi:hypothetical protein